MYCYAWMWLVINFLYSYSCARNKYSMSHVLIFFLQVFSVSDTYIYLRMSFCLCPHRCCKLINWCAANLFFPLFSGFFLIFWICQGLIMHPVVVHLWENFGGSVGYFLYWILFWMKDFSYVSVELLWSWHELAHWHDLYINMLYSTYYGWCRFGPKSCCYCYCSY